jgi:hypothetical protein
MLNLNTLPKTPGNYQLILTAAGSGIFDLAGNPLQSDANTTWVH